MTRRDILARNFSHLPRYRNAQILGGLFQPGCKSFRDVTTVSLDLRETLVRALPWMTVQARHTLRSQRGDTYKAILEIEGGHRIETVLMENSRGHFSICVSSQVGCAMACTFCATGKMGFTRNLSADEIVDQYRYWMYFINERHDLDQQITNVVYMGMGEPLANYEAVKESIQTLLEYTDIGPTRITVSTVGLIPVLTKILTDATWPPVRLAVSLHSADLSTRAQIMPSSYPKFLDDLAAWTRDYFQKFGTRRRHLTFEYVMLAGVNDTREHARKLVAFARRVGKVKINLIPYNDTRSQYASSESQALIVFEQLLRHAGLDVTRRRTMGADIAAACGQLIVETPQS